MKKCVLLILCLCISVFLPLTVCAEENSYGSLAESSGLIDLQELLPDEVKQTLSELGVDLSYYESFSDIKIDSVVSLFKSYIIKGFKRPITALLLAMVILVVFSLVSGLFNDKTELTATHTYICLLCVLTVVLMPFIQSATALVSAAKSVGTFMLSFIPVFAGILLMSGQITTSTVYSGLMLMVANVITNALTFFVSPSVSIYMALGLSSTLSGIEGANGLCIRLKNAVNWVLGLIMTVFSAFLSIQTVVSKSADNLAIKTTRFLLGSSVPVAGGALGEALTTVTASMSLLRSGAMAWCLLVITLVVLPPIIELCLWRFAFAVLSAVAQLLSAPDCSKLFDVASAAAGLLMAIILSVMALFIISLALVGGAS